MNNKLIIFLYCVVACIALSQPAKPLNSRQKWGMGAGASLLIAGAALASDPVIRKNIGKPVALGKALAARGFKHNIPLLISIIATLIGCASATKALRYKSNNSSQVDTKQSQAETKLALVESDHTKPSSEKTIDYEDPFLNNLTQISDGERLLTFDDVFNINNLTDFVDYWLDANSLPAFDFMYLLHNKYTSENPPNNDILSKLETFYDHKRRNSELTTRTEHQQQEAERNYKALIKEIDKLKNAKQAMTAEEQKRLAPVEQALEQQRTKIKEAEKEAAEIMRDLKKDSDDKEKTAEEIKIFYIEELKQYANKGKSEFEKICLAAEQLKKLFIIPQEDE